MMLSESDARAAAGEAALWRRRFEEACERLESKHLSLVDLEAALDQAQRSAEALRAELQDVRRRLQAEESRHAEAIASLAAAEARLFDSVRRSEAIEAQLSAARAESAALNERLSEIDPVALARGRRLTRLAERFPRVAAACRTAWRTTERVARLVGRSRVFEVPPPAESCGSCYLHVLIGPAASDGAPMRPAKVSHEPIAAGSQEP